MDGKDHFRPLARHLQLDAGAFRRIVGGVGQEVEKYLTDAVCIGLEYIHVVGNVDVEPDIVVAHTLADTGGGSGNRFHDGNLTNLQFHDACIDRCEIKNIIDDGQQYR